MALAGKQPKQQLSKGMEHLRLAVTVPETPATAALDSADDAAAAGSPKEIAAYGVPTHFQPIRKPLADSQTTDNEKRSDPFQFGSRYLQEGDDIFAYNAWDHVEVDDAYKTFIETQAEFQRSSPVSDFDKTRFNEHPEKWWDKFYSHNQANFFKDRKWLTHEFPILGEITKEGYGDVTVLEIGAGAGNTAFPLVAMNSNAGLRLHACDYSKKAVEVIREKEACDGKTMRADVWDVAAQGETALPPGLEPGSVDVAIMIFVFSALSPSQWEQAQQNVWQILKPGGRVLFRDYGRGDLAQVRFKKGRYLEENFYIRGDGTRVYFFERDELEQIWSKDGRFEILNLGVDRRMVVNRQRKLKMYRCWMQGLFQKPDEDSSTSQLTEPHG